MTPSEWGARGYEVLVATYGEHRINQWRRRGGRKPNRSLAEIQAATGESRTRTRRRGATPSSTTHASAGEKHMAQDKPETDRRNSDFFWLIRYEHTLKYAIDSIEAGFPEHALKDMRRVLAEFGEHICKTYAEYGPYRNPSGVGVAVGAALYEQYENSTKHMYEKSEATK